MPMLTGLTEINADLQMVSQWRGLDARKNCCRRLLIVCIADETKLVDVLGAIVPVEVIPMARSLVARELAKLGAQPIWRTLQIPTAVTGYWICTVYQLGVQMSSRGRSKRYLASYAAVYCEPVDKVFAWAAGLCARRPCSRNWM